MNSSSVLQAVMLSVLSDFELDPDVRYLYSNAGVSFLNCVWWFDKMDVVPGIVSKQLEKL